MALHHGRWELWEWSQAEGTKETTGWFGNFEEDEWEFVVMVENCWCKLPSASTRQYSLVVASKISTARRLHENFVVPFLHILSSLPVFWGYFFSPKIGWWLAPFPYQMCWSTTCGAKDVVWTRSTHCGDWSVLNTWEIGTKSTNIARGCPQLKILIISALLLNVRVSATPWCQNSCHFKESFCPILVNFFFASIFKFWRW